MYRLVYVARAKRRTVQGYYDCKQSFLSPPPLARYCTLPFSS